MILGIIGSRNIKVNDLGKYLPKDVTEIVSGGAVGVDTCAREYAHKTGIPLTEFLPEYERYGKSAPLKRNLQIIDYCDQIYAFWDGSSRGTYFVIKNCRLQNKKVKVFIKNV